MPVTGDSDSGFSEGVVGEIIDGDSVVLTDGRQVRYLGIDCPEAGQPAADEARRLNRRLVKGRKVRLSFAGTVRKDRYGRFLALVYLPGVGPRQRERCVNVELVLQGVAWAYFHDSNEAASEVLRPLISAQKEAVKQMRGVWREWFARQALAESLVATPLRLHRRGCSAAGKQTVREVVSIAREFGEGRSPCRECRPFQR